MKPLLFLATATLVFAGACADLSTKSFGKEIKIDSATEVAASDKLPAH